MKTTLYIVRHGEAMGNIIRNFHGFFNSDLTENGLLQVSRLAKRMKSIRLDAAYSSDLQRALKTAEAITEGRSLDIQLDENLREINGGEWEDIPWDDLPVKYSDVYGVWLNTPWDVTLPEGESMRHFYDRLVMTVEKIIAENQGKNILIATHGTAIRVLMCYFYGKPLQELNEIFWCDNASLTQIDYEDGKYNVAINGDNSHLKDISTIEKQKWWLDEHQNKESK